MYLLICAIRNKRKINQQLMRLLPTGVGGDRKEWGVGMGTEG